MMTLMLNLVSFIIPPFLETRCKFRFSYFVRYSVNIFNSTFGSDKALIYINLPYASISVASFSRLLFKKK